jgi:hypothetical protein
MVAGVKGFIFCESCFGRSVEGKLGGAGWRSSRGREGICVLVETELRYVAISSVAGRLLPQKSQASTQQAPCPRAGALFWQGVFKNVTM